MLETNINITFDIIKLPFMDIKFDFEISGFDLKDFSKGEETALNKLRDFIKQRFGVLKEDIERYPNGYTVFYLQTDDVNEPIQVFGYPLVLADRMRQCFGQSEFEYILSELLKILPF